MGLEPISTSLNVENAQSVSKVRAVIRTAEVFEASAGQAYGRETEALTT